MKKTLKRILLITIVVVIAGVSTCIWGFYKALRTFGIEDQIHGVFFPVSMAIERYVETNGTPPKTLDQLVPTFLPTIPTSPLVYKLEFTVIERSNWIMNAHSTALKPDRIYSWRSDWKFTDQEKNELLKKFHNVAVFKE